MENLCDQVKKINKQSRQLDPVGFFFSTVSSERNPAVFGLTVHIKEKVDKERLQHAVNDLMVRYPMFHVRLKQRIFTNCHEIQKEPPKVIHTNSAYTPCQVFGQGKDHEIRFLYKENSITVEVLHTVCDGRGLTQFVRALIVRYYELDGVHVEQQFQCIDNQIDLLVEETENAFLRYYKKEDTISFKDKKTFHLSYQEEMPQHAISCKFNLQEIKEKSKRYGVTITTYILGILCSELLKEREKTGSKEPIVISIPVDCRKYFPSKSLKNFACAIKIVVEEVSVFPKLLSDIQQQLNRADQKYLQANINEMQKLLQIARFLPVVIQKIIFRLLYRYSIGGYTMTTGFSNVGYLSFPSEVQEHVDHLELMICKEAGCPYQFSCISTGNILTVTIVSVVKDATVLKRIFRKLEDSIE